MDSFEELGLAPEMVEALAAEGLEVPTALQEQLVPVVARENDVIAVAGPGSGMLVATAVPLLGRLEPGSGGPVALLATADSDRAVALADALGRYAVVTGHRVAAMGGGFALADHASFLCGSVRQILDRIRGGHLSVENVGAIIVDDAAGIVKAGDRGALETLLDGLPSQAQRIMAALPFTEDLEEIVEKHFGRAVRVPPGAERSDSPPRGSLTVTPIEGDPEEILVRAIGDSLNDEHHHAVVFVRSEDRAADLGDRLTLRGYLAGRCGDPEAPVWVAVDALEARAAMEETESGVVPISLDVPADEDELDRRHGSGRGGRVMVAPRELPHLRAIARRAGYTLEVARVAPPARGASSLARVLASVEEAVDDVDVDAYQTALEPLFSRHGAPTVAAALLGMLRARPTAPVATPASEAPAGELARVFISVGTKDGAGPRDLMGAITGEAGVKGDAVGKIDVRETFSVVEIRRDVADKVIKSLNGTTIRGRSARVDYDRSERSGGGRARGPSRGPRGGGGGRRDRGSGPRRS